MTPADLHTLLDLQKKDLTLLQLKKEAGELPKRKEEAASIAARARERAEEARSRETRAQAAIDRIELEVQSLREQVGKYKTQQMQAKSNEQYKTFESEIAGVEGKVREREERELEEMAELEEARAEHEIARREQAEAESESEERGKELELRLETIRDTFGELKAEREVLAARVEEEILTRYMSLLGKKQQAVVVPIQKGSCGACHMKLSPQTLHDAHSGSKWTACGFCGVLLYDPDVN